MRPRGLVYVGWLSMLAAVLDASMFDGVVLEGSGDDQPFAPEPVDNQSMQLSPSNNLTRYLLSKHNLNAPPDGLIDVYYEMDFVHILGIDELKQTMTALVYVDEKWVDPSLSWNPSDFNGMERTWLPLKAIWLPDIIIFNMLMHEDLLTTVRAPGTIHYNGTVEVGNPAVYTVSCTINIKRFPLDEQICSFEVASWAYSDDKLKLHSHSEHSMEHFLQNEEWELIDISITDKNYSHEGIEVSEIEYHVSVKRKPLFYMVTLTFPSYVMCAISIVGLFARFSTTGEREERFTLGVTSILTMAVLSLVVSEKVPHSSTAIPLLVAYFLFNMVIVSLAAMTTGLVMRVHRKGRNGKQPPLWLQHIFFVRTRRRRGRHTANNNDLGNAEELQDLPNNTNNTNNTEERRTNAINLFVERLAEACDAVQAEIARSQHARTAPHGRMHGEENGWIKIADRLDLIFMITYISLVTGPVLYLFGSM